MLVGFIFTGEQLLSRGSANLDAFREASVRDEHYVLIPEVLSQALALATMISIYNLAYNQRL